MKANVDLTEARTFSIWRGNHIRLGSFFKDLPPGVDSGGRFYHILKLEHWTSRCLYRVGKYMRDIGFRFFDQICKETSVNEDIPIERRNGGYHCPRCGKIAAPWKTYCRQCNFDMSKEVNITLDQSVSWPYGRDTMKSNPSILVR